MKNTSIKIGLIGLGYVGLPLAVEMAKTMKVIGYDKNQNRIDELQKSIDKTFEVSTEELKSAENLSFTSSITDLKNCNFYIVTVPTPIDDAKVPDLGPLLLASNELANILSNDDIVVYESTVYPGATEEVCLPILENGSGIKVGKDFGIGYSPERINPADKSKSLRDIVKIISANDSKTLKRISEVYNNVIDAGLYTAESIRVAEAAKVIENTQRDLNIALINEFSQIFSGLGISTKQVLKAASTKWNFLNFHPGLVGGHCIGVDPYYLTHKSKQIGHNPELILAGRHINDKYHEYAATKFVQALGKSKKKYEQKIIILGATFKANCPDIRNSRVMELIKFLKNFNLELYVHDPLVPVDDIPKDLKHLFISNLQVNRYDSLILAVPHDIFLTDALKTEYQRVREHGGIVFDLYDQLDGGYLTL